MNEDRERKQGTKTGDQDRERRRATKTRNNNRETRQATKTGIEDREPRQETKKGNQDREPRIEKKKRQRRRKKEKKFIRCPKPVSPVSETFFPLKNSFPVKNKKNSLPGFRISLPNFRSVSETIFPVSKMAICKRLRHFFMAGRCVFIRVFNGAKSRVGCCSLYVGCHRRSVGFYVFYVGYHSLCAHYAGATCAVTYYAWAVTSSTHAVHPLGGLLQPKCTLHRRYVCCCSLYTGCYSLF